jgi:hypothetical protein
MIWLPLGRSVKRIEGVWWVGTEDTIESGADQKHFGQENHQLIILIVFAATASSTLEFKPFGTKLVR